MRVYINKNIQDHIAKHRLENESLQDTLQRLLDITVIKAVKERDWRRMKVGESCTIVSTGDDAWYKFFGEYKRHIQRHTNKTFSENFTHDNETYTMRLTRIA